MFVLSAALGMAAVSLWTFAIGFAGLLHYPLLIVAPLLLMAALGAFDWYRQHRLSSAEASTSEPIPWPWIAAAAPIVICTLLGGMMPPYEYDVLEYHLRLPTEWIASGRIAVEPLISRSIPLAETVEAIANPARAWEVKVMVTPGA
jgi:hypothetical protein